MNMHRSIIPFARGAFVSDFLPRAGLNFKWPRRAREPADPVIVRYSRARGKAFLAFNAIIAVSLSAACSYPSVRVLRVAMRRARG